jgi:hypothetical protein
MQGGGRGGFTPTRTTQKKDDLVGHGYRAGMQQQVSSLTEEHGQDRPKNEETKHLLVYLWRRIDDDVFSFSHQERSYSLPEKTILFRCGAKITPTLL